MLNPLIFNVHQDKLHIKLISPTSCSILIRKDSALLKFFIKHSCQTLIKCAIVLIVVPQFALIIFNILGENDNLNKRERIHTPT